MVLLFLPLVPRVKCWTLRWAVVKLVIVIVVQILKKEVLLIFVFW
jgi:hypothetical protein